MSRRTPAGLIGGISKWLRFIFVRNHAEIDFAGILPALHKNPPAARFREVKTGSPLVAGPLPGRSQMSLRPPDWPDHHAVGLLCLYVEIADARHAPDDLQILVCPDRKMIRKE